jgi:hypothetical protein
MGLRRGVIGRLLGLHLGGDRRRESCLVSTSKQFVGHRFHCPVNKHGSAATRSSCSWKEEEGLLAVDGCGFSPAPELSGKTFGESNEGVERVIYGSGNSKFRASPGDVAIQGIDLRPPPTIHVLGRRGPCLGHLRGDP